MPHIYATCRMISTTNWGKMSLFSQSYSFAHSLFPFFLSCFFCFIDFYKSCLLIYKYSLFCFALLCFLLLSLLYFGLFCFICYIYFFIVLFCFALLYCTFCTYFFVCFFVCFSLFFAFCFSFFVLLDFFLSIPNLIKHFCFVVPFFGQTSSTHVS